jgi:hypothetical protein
LLLPEKERGIFNEKNKRQSHVKSNPYSVVQYANPSKGRAKKNKFRRKRRDEELVLKTQNPPF